MQRWTALILAVVGLLVFSIIITRSRSNDAQRATDLASPAQDGEQHPAAGGGRVPVIVELFTSEGCSSCPPADELLRRLAQTQPVAGAEVIALEQHVDYWNRLGWTDPFSAAQFSARQGEYAAAFNHDGVYTPQMIVDGLTEFSGGNAPKARAAIVQAVQTPKANLILTRAGATKPDGVSLSVRVDKLPKLSADDTVEVLLAITEDNLRTNVPSGENAGHTLAHAAVVRQLRVLGQISPRGSTTFTAQPTITLGAQWQRKNLRAVVFVQAHDSRRMLGAAALKLTEE